MKSGEKNSLLVHHSNRKYWHTNLGHSYALELTLRIACGHRVWIPRVVESFGEEVCQWGVRLGVRHAFLEKHLGLGPWSTGGWMLCRLAQPYGWERGAEEPAASEAWWRGV